MWFTMTARWSKIRLRSASTLSTSLSSSFWRLAASTVRCSAPSRCCVRSSATRAVLLSSSRLVISSWSQASE